MLTCSPHLNIVKWNLPANVPTPQPMHHRERIPRGSCATTANIDRPNSLYDDCHENIDGPNSLYDRRHAQANC
jgi:hypothetical protein